MSDNFESEWMITSLESQSINLISWNASFFKYYWIDNFYQSIERISFSIFLEAVLNNFVLSFWRGLTKAA